MQKVITDAARDTRSPSRPERIAASPSVGRSSSPWPRPPARPDAGGDGAADEDRRVVTDPSPIDHRSPPTSTAVPTTTAAPLTPEPEQPPTADPAPVADPQPVTAKPTPTAEPAPPAVIILEQGDTGPKVRAFQSRLRQIGWFSGDVSDRYGTKTTAAVRGFQAKRGFPVTGSGRRAHLRQGHLDDAAPDRRRARQRQAQAAQAARPTPSRPRSRGTSTSGA